MTTLATTLEIIDAPCNLGLRPLRPGHEPGAWRAPQALRAAGLHHRLDPAHQAGLARPGYSADLPPGTRLLNGPMIRHFAGDLAALVAATLDRGGFPLVLGGDCSILLGCLLAARRSGICGLVHVDGHSDFRHPGNYDAAALAGSVAGMDLALATGRGEPLLADWGPGLTPLLADRDVVQIGERENADPGYAFPDITRTAIHRLDIRAVLARGIEAIAASALAAIAPRPVWLHVDLDVLDAAVLPAVDSPGGPGLDYAQLARLVRLLRASGRIIGADVTIFDPDLDPDGGHARAVTACLAAAFGRDG